MNIEDYIIETFCFIDDEIKKITSHTKLRNRGFKPALSDSEVISMEIIGEFIHIDTDKGLWTYFFTCWKHFFPKLSDRTTFTRQASNLWRMKQILQEKFLQKMDHHKKDLYIIDGFPVTVTHFKRAHFSKLFKQEAAYGYCATKEMNYFGFKGHVLINNFGAIQGFTLAAANIDERIAMREIIDHKIQGILLGDKGYIVLDEVDKELDDLNIDLQTPLRSNMLDLRHPYFKKKFASKRRLVETVIGQLSERFNIEQNWARDIWHLTNRMSRKILSHTFSVFLNVKYGRSPLDFDGLVTV